MYEIVFADAQPEAVRLYNKRMRSHEHHGPPAMQPLQPPVDWDGNDVTRGEGIEVSVLMRDEPEDREVQDLMLALEATALTVRKSEWSP